MSMAALTKDGVAVPDGASSTVAVPVADDATSTDVAVVSYTTHLTAKALRGHLFALSQYARRVSDVTQEDTVAPSPFHSVSEPPIDLAEYVIDAAIKCRFDKFTVLLSFAYVGAYSRAVNRPPSILSVHRLCAAALYTAGIVLRPQRAIAASVMGKTLGVSIEELLALSARVAEKMPAVPDALQLEELFQHLEVARGKSLRRDIAAAVADALGLPEPVPSPALPRRTESTPHLLSRALHRHNSSSQLQVPTDSNSPMSRSASPGSLSSPGARGGDSSSPRLSFAGGSGLGLVRLLLGNDQQQPDPPRLPCSKQPVPLPTSTNGPAALVEHYSLPTFGFECGEDEPALPPVRDCPPPPPPPAAPSSAPFAGRRQHVGI